MENLPPDIWWLMTLAFDVFDVLFPRVNDAIVCFANRDVLTVKVALEFRLDSLNLINFRRRHLQKSLACSTETFSN
jgi:hypothetical protein